MGRTRDTTSLSVINRNLQALWVDPKLQTQVLFEKVYFHGTLIVTKGDDYTDKLSSKVLTCNATLYYKTGSKSEKNAFNLFFSSL